MSTRAERVARLRPIVLRLLQRRSLREVAELLEVSVGAIRNLKDRRTPQEETLERMEDAARAHGELEISTPAPAIDDDTHSEAHDLFAYFEGIIRHMGGPDTDPEEMRLRRLDALEGLRRFFTARGPVPAWWYRIKERVERGEV